MRAPAACLAAAVALLAGCGGDSGAESAATRATEAVSVPEAKKIGAGDPVTIEGYIVQAPNSYPRLCEALAESSPPQCGGASFVIEGPDPAAFGFVLEEQSLTQWTAKPIQLTGVIREDGTQLFIPETDR